MIITVDTRNLHMKKQDVTIDATKTSFKIISEIQRRDNPTLTEISDALESPKSTVYYHLNTLEELGYIEKKGEKFTLTLRFLRLGDSARKHLPVYTVGKEEVEKLAEETNTNGYLMVEQNNVGVIAYLQKENDIHLGDSVGQPVHLASTAMGKVFLAHLPDDRVSEIIDQHGLPQVTDHSITDEQELFDELEAIRSRGYATNKSEQVEGLNAVGAPILGSDDAVHGSISISAPKQHLSEDAIEETYVEQVLSAANIIELKLIRKLRDPN
jgi:DNA-binding IclR family transcriptional regulator